MDRLPVYGGLLKMVKSLFAIGLLVLVCGSAFGSQAPRLQTLDQNVLAQHQERQSTPLDNLMPVERNGWIYQRISTGIDNEILVYRGGDQAATITVCTGQVPIRLVMARATAEVRNGYCLTVTTPSLSLSTYGEGRRGENVVLRYKFLAVGSQMAFGSQADN